MASDERSLLEMGRHLVTSKLQEPTHVSVGHKGQLRVAVGFDVVDELLVRPFLHTGLIHPTV
jgi:hypothetical protein